MSGEFPINRIREKKLAVITQAHAWRIGLGRSFGALPGVVRLIK